MILQSSCCRQYRQSITYTCLCAMHRTKLETSFDHFQPSYRRAIRTWPYSPSGMSLSNHNFLPALQSKTTECSRLCWHQHPPQLANLDAGRRKQIGFSNVFPLTSRSHRKAIRLSERLRACIGQGPHTEPQPNCRTRTLCQMEGQLFHTVSIPLRFRPDGEQNIKLLHAVCEILGSKSPATWKR